MEIHECTKFDCYTDPTTVAENSNREFPKVIQRLMYILEALLWMLSGLVQLIEPTLKLIWLTQEALLEAAEWCNGSPEECSKHKVTNRRDEFVSNNIFWRPQVVTSVMDETLRYLGNKPFTLDSDRWNSCSESKVHLFEGRTRRTYNGSRIKSRMFRKNPHAYSVSDLNPRDSSVGRPKSADILDGVRFRDGGINVKNVEQVRAAKLRFRKSGSRVFHADKQVVTLSREQITLALQSLQHLIDLGLLQNVINNEKYRNLVVEELQTSA